MRGGRVGFIENRARLAQHHHARRMTVLRELWYCHVAVLSFHASSPSNPPRFPCAYPFLSDFRGQFWRSSGTQTGSCGISSESSRRPLSNDIKFARIGVRTRELWLPEVGVSELFSCTLPAKIPIKRGMLSANREFHDVAGVIIFPTHPGSRINLLRAGKTLRAKAAVREKKCVLLPARFFSNLVPVPDSRESELGLVRYGPASRVHRGVFGPFEGSFPIRIPADPDKFLAIREFHVVHGCVLFPMCPGSQINLLRVRKTLCASAATSVGKFRKFQHSLISSACFHARGRRSSRCRISDDLGIVGKLALPTFQRYKALHRGELGFARYDLANRRPSECSLCQGGWSVRSSFWSGQRSGQTLVKLGQPWSNLVGIWSKLSKLLEMYPGLHFKGFWARRTLVGLETARSNLGQTSVNPSQTWSNLGKCVSDLLLGVFDAESPRRIRPAWFGLSRFACRHRENPGVSWLEMMSRGMLLAIRADGASVTQCLVRACSRQESRLGTRALSSGLNILSLRCMLSSDVACVFMPSGADSALLDASSCLSSLHAWHAVVRLVVLWSSVRDGMTMKSSMCPTAASLRCVVVVDHVGVLVLSVAEHNVGSGLSLPFSTQHKLSRLKRTIAVPVHEHVRP
uniref:Uncharacterized protein n=1 Tax=Fagus sylvatica TaxID=28930 RepID=A0A2N9HT36_FAGSY